MGHQYNWANLSKHLSEYASLVNFPNASLTLSIDEIAKIVETNTVSPPDFFRKANYWYNGKSNIKSSAWTSVGFNVVEASLIPIRGNVTFVKSNGISSVKISKLKNLLYVFVNDEDPIRKKMFSVSAVFIVLLTIISSATSIAYHLYTVNPSKVKIQLENSNHWYEMGEKYRDEQNYEKAIEYFTEALKYQVEINGEKSKETVVIRFSMGDTYNDYGALDKAEEEYYHILLTSENIRFEKKYLDMLRLKLAGIYIHNFEFEKADDMMEQIFQTMTKKESDELTDAIVFLFSAWHEYVMNESKEYNNLRPGDEGRYYSTGLFGEHRFDASMLYTALAIFQLEAALMLRTGEYESARFRYELELALFEALEYYNNENHSFEIAVACDNIGISCLYALNAGVVLQRKDSSGKPIEQARGIDYVLDMFKKANLIFAEKLGSKNVHTAISYMNLSNIYLEIGNYKSAIENMQRAVDICEYLFSGKNDLLAIAYDGLAKCYCETEEFEFAEILFQKSIDTYYNSYCIDNAITYYSYVLYLISNNRVEDAGTYIRKAKAILNVMDVYEKSSLLTNFISVEQLVEFFNEFEVNE
jgi:tetratricopeptide (TPR) repeat protein